MRYFVTGGGGFIGGELVRQLTDAGHDCVLILRNPDKVKDTPSASNPRVTIHKGDITDKESMRAPMEGCDGVFHLAAWFKVGCPKETRIAEESNVNGTRNVLELMKELNIQKGVYTSTLAVNSDTRGVVVDESYEFKGRHLSVYDLTKWEAHFQVAKPMMEAGLPLVIVMPGGVYGPGDTGPFHDFFVKYLKRQLPATPSGTEFCWAHVGDTAKGHILAMEKGKIGESYIIAGPRATIIGALEIAEKICGVKPPTFHPSPLFLKAVAGVLTPFSLVLPLPTDSQPEALRVMAGTTYLGSNGKAKAELGFDPRPIEDGFKELLDFEMRGLGMTKASS